MIKDKALKKILVASTTLLIILTIYVIKDFSKPNTLQTKVRICNRSRHQ